MRYLASLLFALLLVVASVAVYAENSADSAGVVLQYKFRPGQVIRYDVSASDYQPDVPTGVDPTVEFKGVLKIEPLAKSADGVSTVRLSYDSLKVHQDSGNRLGYEPKPASEVPPITIKVRANGQITNWREYEGHWPGDVKFTDVVDGHACPRTVNVYRPVVFFLWQVLPGGKMKVGDQWTSDSADLPKYAPRVSYVLPPCNGGYRREDEVEIYGRSAELLTEDAGSGNHKVPYYDFICILFLPEKGVIRKLWSHRNRALDLPPISAVELRLIEADTK